MSHFNLVTLLPRPETLGAGSFSLGKDGIAQFFEGDCAAGSKILATLERVRLDGAAAAGLYLSGMEPDGVDASGRPKFKYQEWLLRHLV